MHEKPLLLLIDFQNAYLSGQEWECPNIDSAVNNATRLINSDLFNTIISTRYIATESPTGVWKEYNQKYDRINNDIYLNEEITEISKALHNASSNHQVAKYDKSTYSALSNNAIKEAVLSASYVVIAGVTTGCCVLSTVMELIDLGVYATIIKDATAGTSIACEEAVWTVLEGLSPLHINMVYTDDFLASPRDTTTL